MRSSPQSATAPTPDTATKDPFSASNRLVPTPPPGTVIQHGDFSFVVGPADQREVNLCILDVSSSMSEPMKHAGGNRLDAARQCVSICMMEKASRDDADGFGIIAFSSRIVVCHPPRPLRTEQAKLNQTLSRLRPIGGTDISAALSQAATSFDPADSGAVKRAILLTDGHSQTQFESAAAKLIERGVLLDVIGIGDTPSDVDEPRLKQVASVVGGQCRYRFFNNADDLREHWSVISHKTVIR